MPYRILYNRSKFNINDFLYNSRLDDCDIHKARKTEKPTIYLVQVFELKINFSRWSLFKIEQILRENCY